MKQNWRKRCWSQSKITTMNILRTMSNRTDVCLNTSSHIELKVTLFIRREMKTKTINWIEKAASALLRSDEIENGYKFFDHLAYFMSLMHSNQDLIEACLWLHLITKLTDFLKRMRSRSVQIMVRTYNQLLSQYSQCVCICCLNRFLRVRRLVANSNIVHVGQRKQMQHILLTLKYN